MERGGGQQWRVMEDCSNDERLRQEMPRVDRRVRRTSIGIDEAERSGHLASVSDGQHSSSHSVKVVLPKSSRESTSETTIDWRTSLDTDWWILHRWHRMVKQKDMVFPMWDLIDISESENLNKCRDLARCRLVRQIQSEVVVVVSDGLDDWRTARWTLSC